VAARIPTWKSGLLTHAGRVLLTKVTLSSIPVHLSIACCLSPWGVQQIDKRRRAFLGCWVKCKVSWPIVCKPTELGGLGVLDLRFFWLCTQAAVGMACTSRATTFLGILAFQDGEVGRLCTFAPDLYIVVSARGRKRTLRDGLFQNRWARDITGATTVQVLLLVPVCVAGVPSRHP
jgi:hypothetical protein